MCGPTKEETQIQQEQIDAYQQAQELTAAQYARQNSIYGPMQKQFQSIFDQGPNQRGFSADQRANLNAQTVEGTATNFAGASRAVQGKLATLGGGTNPLEPGQNAAIRGEVASSSAAEQSREENQIVQDDYQQGYNEWLRAGQGLEDIASGVNPLGFENAATSSGSAASDTATKIAAQENSWETAALGAAGSLGEGWASGGFKH